MKRNYINPNAERQYRQHLNTLDTFPFYFTYAGKEYAGFGELLRISTDTCTKNGVETTKNVFKADALTISLITSF